MNKAYLSIGSNTGDRLHNINDAIARMLTYGVNIIDDSSVYETPCCHGKGPDYLNCVLLVTFTTTYDVAVAITKNIERDMGRTPGDKITGNVPIDIDIVIWNDKIIRDADFAREYFTYGYKLLSPATHAT